MRRAMALLAAPVAILGILFAGPATVSAGSPSLSVVDFTVYACPASIQTPAELDAAGGAQAVCAVAGQPGDFGTLPSGFTWQIAPIEYDLQASLHVHGTTLTGPAANAGGSCDTITMVCNAFQAYAWFNVPAGKTTLTESTIPTGFALGWANVSADGQAIASTINGGSVSFKPPRGAQTVYAEVIDIVP